MSIAKKVWNVLLTLSCCAVFFDKEQMRENIEIISNISALIVIQNVTVVIAIAAICFGLLKAFPFLEWSWFSLFSRSDENTDQVAERSGINIHLLPAEVKYFGPVFLIILMLNLPHWAYMEEVWFRQDTISWGHGVYRSLVFGMVHCLVGVPLAAGLSISVCGLWFTYQYFLGGVELSTLHHTTYNLILVSLLFVVLLLRHIFSLQSFR